MQTPALAARVHDIFGQGLDLHERVTRGDDVDFRTEHGRLRRLLFEDGGLARDPEYAGDPRGGDDQGRFLGVRYALACWLDELFINDCEPWKELWSQDALEPAVIGEGSQDRAWRFWVQARLAEGRPSTDALEVYLWCVMLGFKGEPEGEHAGGLDPIDWANRTRQHIIKARNQKFPHDAGGSPRPDVPVLSGRRDFVRMLRVGTVVVAAAGLFAAFRIASGQ